MMLTKNQLAIFVTFASAAYFFLFFSFLPAEVVESRTESKAWFFAMKIGFLSIVFAAVTSSLLVATFRREFIKAQLANFNRFRHLLRLLVRRDFILRYRNSMLGILWSLLNPLLAMLILTAVFSYIFARHVPNFPVYLISGLLIFGFFSEATSQAMGSIVNSAGIIKKVYIPKYIFPLARIISSLVNLFFLFLVFLLIFAFTGAQFHWTLFLLPIPILYVFFFSLGIGLLLSSLSVFFRDLTYLYGVFTTLLMYLSAIFYPVDILPERVQSLLGLNPIYHFIDYFRCLALHGTVPDLWSNIVCLGFVMLALCSGLYVFMSQRDKFILYL